MRSMILWLIIYGFYRIVGLKSEIAMQHKTSFRKEFFALTESTNTQKPLRIRSGVTASHLQARGVVSASTSSRFL